MTHSTPLGLLYPCEEMLLLLEVKLNQLFPLERDRTSVGRLSMLCSPLKLAEKTRILGALLFIGAIGAFECGGLRLDVALLLKGLFSAKGSSFVGVSPVDVPELSLVSVPIEEELPFESVLCRMSQLMALFPPSSAMRFCPARSVFTDSLHALCAAVDHVSQHCCLARMSTISTSVYRTISTILRCQFEPKRLPVSSDIQAALAPLELSGFTQDLVWRSQRRSGTEPPPELILIIRSLTTLVNLVTHFRNLRSFATMSR
mmetsp:Transcript_6815/g.9396  ORF Transcript_6815/g.9396 Transcript_6815/m.9396 type:complete len:259 (-) Transcript_6815:550-1326(-)